MQSADNSTWFHDKEVEAAAHTKRGRKRSVVDKERRELAKKVLLAAHERLESWERVAKFYGLSKAAAHRIANDNTYRPSKAMLNSIIETDLPTDRRVRWIEYRAASKPARRTRPRVRRPWMGAELSAAMDAAGVSDADVRQLVAAMLEGQR